MQIQPKGNPMPSNDKNQVQGEGDYASNKRYVESVKDFVQSGKVDQAARKAKPESPAEEQQLQSAERAGESRSKGEDPSLKHAPPRKP